MLISNGFVTIELFDIFAVGLRAKLRVTLPTLV